MNCYVISIIQFRVKVFQELLMDTNISFQNNSFVCTQINASKNSYGSLTIQLDISHLFAHSRKIIYRAISVVIFFLLVWMRRLAAGMGVGVRSMPTESFG